MQQNEKFDWILEKCDFGQIRVKNKLFQGQFKNLTFYLGANSSLKIADSMEG